MKLECDRQELYFASQRMQGAVSDRSLSHIALKADSNNLTFAATDRLLAVYSEIDCPISKPGSVFVPAKLFLEVVKELPSGIVQLESDGHHLTVTSLSKGGYMITIPLVSGLEWQEPPEFESIDRVELSAKMLGYMISQVQYCIAAESPRNYGSVGYLHQSKDHSLRLVGTDGFRLSFCDFKAPIPEGFLDKGVCLSKRALSEIARLCSEGFEKVSVSISEDKTTILVETAGYQIFVRLSAVTYPNYLAVLPKNEMAEVTIPKSFLQSAVKRVLLAADKKTKALQLNFTDSLLTLSSKAIGSSEGKEDIPIESYNGPDRFLVVNGKYMTDVLSAHVGDNVKLRFRDSSEPMVFLPADKMIDCRSEHILVPIKETEA